MYAAQSIHWIDPAVRYAKIARTLRAGGTVAILRNEKRPIDSALRAALDAAYAGSPIAVAAPDSIDAIVASLVDELDASGCFGEVAVTEVPWSQHLDAAAYVALLATYSDHAVLEPAARDALLGDVARAIEAHGGITIPYVSLAWIAKTATA